MKRRIINTFKIFLCFLFFNFISIKQWEQINTFTKSDYLNVVTNAKICAQDLQEGQYYNQWSIFFDDLQKIKIKNVFVNDKKADFNIQNNELKIDIGELFNDQNAKIKIEYDEYYSQNVDFIKRHYINVPNYAKGAKCRLVIKIPNDFIIYSDLHYLKKTNQNTLEWKGIPNTTIAEEIGLCLKKASWDVNTIVSVFSDKLINGLEMTIDLIYVGGNNDVQNFSIFCNNKKLKKYQVKDNIIFVTKRFKNTDDADSFQKYEFKAHIDNSCLGEYCFDDSLLVSDDPPLDENIDFISLLNNILLEDKSNSPVYVKICHWVNKYLQYDLEMAGKKMGAESIFIKKKGVCEHYAILFKRFMQVLNIPCYVVSGLAYSFISKAFIPHAWNVIYYQNRWIPIDPTWNISSGIVPISHIFTKIDLDNRSGIKVKVDFKNSQKNNRFTMNIKQEARFLQ